MQAFYATQEEVPEALKDEYIQGEDGTFALKLDGTHPAVTAVVKAANTKVGEFRNNGITKDKALTAAQAQLDALAGITPEIVAALKAENETLTAGKKTSKSNEETQAMISAAVAPLTEALAQERQARETAQREVAAEKISGRITQAGIKAGVAKTAMGDFLNRGKEAFKLVDGSLQATDENGQPRYSKARPGEVLNVDEWASDLQAEAPHLYKNSTGGGAGGGDEQTGDTRKTVPRAEMKHNLEAVASGEARIGQ